MDSLKIIADPKNAAIIGALFPEKLLLIKPALKKIGTGYRRHIGERFRSGGGSGDLSWPALSPITKKIKKEKFGRDKGPLIGTGRLRRSMTKPSDPENITQIEPERADYGSRTPYALVHRQGSPDRIVKSVRQANFLRFRLGMFNKRKGDPIPLPKRNFVTPDPKLFEEIVTITGNEIKRRMRIVGLEVS